ncbi:hypothetical protein KY285_004152 [Solanum tuberosum]|nr:hypothetical protein KY285_004152 [Solanum tuberosum]
MMEKGDPSQKLYTGMRLWEFPDQYVVEPTDGSCSLCSEISRVDGFIDEIYPCDQSLKNSTAKQKNMGAQFSALLNVVYRTHGLRFSYDVNITLRWTLDSFGTTI